MAIDLSKPTFARLEPGVHDIAISAWNLRTFEDGSQAIEITFAPVANPAHTHHTFIREQFVATLEANLQRVINVPGLALQDLLNASIGKTLTSTLEESVKEDGSRFFNWYLGYTRSQGIPVPVNAAPATRKPRARG